MRNIEKEMLDAIAACESKRIGNTFVQFNRVDTGEILDDFECSIVYLHGNPIATVYNPSTLDEHVVVNQWVLREFPTRTTMSRLRALGVDVCTRKGEVYLNGVPLDNY